jgi:hypothetical protein
MVGLGSSRLSQGSQGDWLECYFIAPSSARRISSEQGSVEEYPVDANASPQSRLRA